MESVNTTGRGVSRTIALSVSSSSESGSAAGVGGSGHVFDTLALEIEQLLAKVCLYY